MDKFGYQKANILSQPNQVKPFYRKNGQRIFTSPRSAMVGQCADTCTDYISGREPNRPRHSNRGYASYNVSLVAVFLPMSCTPDETGPYLGKSRPCKILCTDHKIHIPYTFCCTIFFWQFIAKIWLSVCTSFSHAHEK